MLSRAFASSPFLRIVGAICVACAVCGLSNCSSAARKFELRAQAAGLERVEVLGTQFNHSVYRSRNADAVLEAADTLMVYLDGDGTPGTGRGAEPSNDPTPREPLALSLLMKAARPGIYLTRPCYNALRNQPGCGSALWTSARYSQQVVTSMATALTRYANEHGNPSLVIVGYSGGGALAMLMARKIPHLKGIITIAANLDTQAWTDAHGYLPLDGSLNPSEIDDSPLPTVHLVGERDVNVPPSILGDYWNRHPQPQVWRYASFDHRCCWVDQWPALLEQAMHYIETAQTKR